MKCVTYIYICGRSMRSQGLGGFLSHRWCLLRAVMWGTQPSKPSSTPAKPPGTCFSATTSKLLHLTITAIFPLPKSGPGRIHTPYYNSSVLDYSHSAQWPVGASRPRLQTQMGVQARDGFHMSLCTCKRVLSLLFFFLSLISFFVFLLKMSRWDWETVL